LASNGNSEAEESYANMYVDNMTKSRAYALLYLQGIVQSLFLMYASMCLTDHNVSH